MPKIKENLSQILARTVKDFPGVFRCDSSVLYCLYCNCEVKVNQIGQVKQHLKTTKHKNSVERKDGAKQLLLTTFQTEAEKKNVNQFTVDLLKFFIGANFPLSAIRKECVISFLKKYTNQPIPSETSLRNYLQLIFHQQINQLKSLAKDKLLWISVDETTDVEQRFVVNFTFGILGVEIERDRSYIFSLKVLDEVNSHTIAAFIDQTVNVLGIISKLIKVN